MLINQTIAIVAPRNMRFSPSQATSIDLHIHETVRWSRYRDRITVFAEEVENPFDDIEIKFWPKGASTKKITGLIKDQSPGLIIVHQHLPTAHALIKECPDISVVLVRHNFQKPPRNFLSGFLKQRRMNRLAEIGFVSECSRADFTQKWPEVRVPVNLILNGVDTNLWCPADKKEPIILFVGRLAPEKGALEAAQAMADVLSLQTSWSGIFIVTEAPEHAAYGKLVEQVIDGAGGQISFLSNVSHAAVRDWMARASISLAPTQNREPFGRVAIEALASGTVLIASAKGGFVEIVGEAGILLDTPDAKHIAGALGKLIENDPERQRLSKEGRERVVSQYDLSRSAATFDTLAARLLPGIDR